MADWDAIAAELGMDPDWRAQGFDSPEYMASGDSIYHVRDEDDRPTGTFKCPFPDCRFRRRDLEATFRHVHGAAHAASSSGSADTQGATSGG